ncbi:DUF308 domain-containing protein [Treponema sp. OMZ 840]|uniref:DUF308 domain-containing protein n=1 Tax=Treponema sp. OMZ 840 TaxID=244313 RepID=UPI003D947B1C
MRKTVIAMGVLTAAIGITMLLTPEAVIRTAVTLLGISGIINGIYNVVSLRKMAPDENFRRIITIRGILSILTGAAAVALPLMFAGALWTIMLYVLGAYLLLAAALEIYGVIKLRAQGINTKPFTAEIIASIVLAILLFAVPAAIGLTLIRIIGVCACIVGAGIIIREARNKTTVIYAEEIDD